MPAKTRLLGMDIGTKTIGLAVSDPNYTVATPLGTLKRTKFTQDLHYLEKIVKEYEIGGFVLGLPLNMDGSEGPRCQSVRDFALELKNYPDVVGKQPWIAFWDERFSTAAAIDSLSDLDMKRRKAKDKGIVDKLAAQNILQGALEFIRSSVFQSSNVIS